MGTNFLWHGAALDRARAIADDKMARRPPADESHLGKRSAAGWYCWSCDVPLVEGGRRDLVHTGRGYVERCPLCGKAKGASAKDGGGPAYNAAMVELGFAEARTAREGRPTGVQSASSFSWAQDPEITGGILRRYPDDPLVEDEYGRVLTGREFLAMLAVSCPIQFTHSVGTAYWS